MPGDDRRPDTPPPSRPRPSIIETRPARAVTDDWDWQIHAACRGMDVETFYHPAGERWHRRSQRIAQAKAVCRTCPVITECATWALTTREPYGVWGGLSEEERAAILGIRNLRYPGTPRARTVPDPVSARLLQPR